MMARCRVPIGITMGDPAGVGPELALRALADPELLRQCTPIVVGDASILAEVARGLGWSLPAVPILAAHREVVGRDSLQQPAIIDLGRCRSGDVLPGQVSAQTGAASYAYIEWAIQAALRHDLAGMVTCPIHKEAFHAAGSPFAGHTEMLAELTSAPRHCMMLTSAEITCALVTAHIGLRDVPQALTTDGILAVIELTADALSAWHGRPARLTVCGLNPHAGEQGLFGAREEERIIQPAVDAARRRGLCVTDPLPPDTAFIATQRRQTDAYICMYHDQGLIPLKALAFDTAINVTLGLPILRASVDHGTALDRAWQGTASATSLFAAIRWVAQMAQGTARH